MSASAQDYGVPNTLKTSRPAVGAASVRSVLARNLVALRASLEWSQEELAHRAAVHRTFITQVELQRRNITIDNLEKIAKAVGVLPHELLTPR